MIITIIMMIIVIIIIIIIIITITIIINSNNDDDNNNNNNNNRNEDNDNNNKNKSIATKRNNKTTYNHNNNKTAITTATSLITKATNLVPEIIHNVVARIPDRLLILAQQSIPQQCPLHLDVNNLKLESKIVSKLSIYYPFLIDVVVAVVTVNSCCCFSYGSCCVDFVIVLV